MYLPSSNTPNNSGAANSTSVEIVNIDRPSSLSAKFNLADTAARSPASQSWLRCGSKNSAHQSRHRNHQGRHDQRTVVMAHQRQRIGRACVVNNHVTVDYADQVIKQIHDPDRHCKRNQFRG